MLTPRQALLLGKVVDGFAQTGQPVGSKTLAADPDVTAGPSTIRNELAVLEEQRAARAPAHLGGAGADRRRLPLLRRSAAARGAARASCGLSLVRREVDEAMRVTTETLSQVTNLLAIVSAPPIGTTTIRHIEVLLLQPQVLMVVVITSTGGVSKKVFTFDRPVDPGSGRLGGLVPQRAAGRDGPGRADARARGSTDPSLSPRERAFVGELAPAFIELAETAEDTLYVDGAHRLVSRVPLPGRLAAQRADGDARAAGVDAGRAVRGAGLARRLRADRRREPASRRCSRCRWWPPTTGCRSAIWERCR